MNDAAEIERLRADLKDMARENAQEMRDYILENKRLRAALRAWQRSNEAMEWLDDDSPLVRQTREALEQ